ncbi:hypothetical protein V491_07247 [Pseudogymnoascus sp. VKM F-3775]|nr:hypothetical protein V491_07247 [Pseudogymnoascus sp. VKM F-3775]
MVRRKSLRTTDYDIQLTKAVLGVQSGKYKSSYDAAKQLGLPRNSVTRRVNGGLSRTQARQQQQKLSYAEEKVLLKWIKDLTVSGYSPGHRLLKEVAEEILIIGRRIESVRMDGATKPVLEAWFDAYNKLVQKEKIKQENTYNMDESGFSIGTMESTHTIIDSSLRTKYQAHPGRQEWVSIVECICGDGTSISPLVIFKGKNVLQGWIPNEVLDSCSPPDAQSLQKANELLLLAIERRTIPSTPVRKYIQKLALGTEQLRAKSIVHQHDTNNLRSIIKKRTTRTKGKRVILKGHFHISTQELLKGVVEAELDTKTRAKKNVKTKGRAVSYEAESEEDIEEEARDESESEIEDCIIVDGTQDEAEDSHIIPCAPS